MKLFTLLLLIYSLLYSTSKLSLTKSEREFLKEHKVLRVGVDKSWPPFEFVDSDGVYRGLASEYLEIIEQKLDIEFKIEKSLSWSEVVQKMKNRELDIYSCVLKTPQRVEYMDFTTAYLKFPMVVITLNSKESIEDISDLNNRKVSVVKDYATYEILKLKHPKIELATTKNVQEAIELVAYGKVFAFVGNIATATYYIKKLGFTNLKLSAKTPYDFSISMAGRNDLKELTPILEKALNSISKEERERIYQKWIKLDFEPRVDYELIIEVLIVLLPIFAVIIYWNRKLKQEIYLRKLSEERYKMFSEVSFEGISLLKNGIVIDVNEAVLELLGYQKEEIVGKSPLRFVNKEYEEIVKKHISENIEKSYIAYLIDKSNRAFPCQIRGRVVELNSEIYRVTAILDISDRVEKEKILRELNRELEERVEEESAKRIEQEQLLIGQSKMAQMGEMIGNIAHQWRQPLNTIGLILQKLNLAQNRGKLTPELIESSSKKGMLLINKMSQTIDDFRSFFKPDKAKIDFDLKETILETIELIDASFNYNHIELELDLDENLIIFGYKNEFSQVLLNILNNAKDVLIERKILEAKVKVSLKSTKELIRVKISDNARGVDREIIDRIFEPYFSTKDEHNGTGLGLYMSKMIIEQNMDGELKVSNIASGAEFEIELPIYYR